MRGAAFTGRYTAHDLRAVLGTAFSVEGALAAGDALHDQAGVFVAQYCH